MIFSPAAQRALNNAIITSPVRAAGGRVIGRAGIVTPARAAGHATGCTAHEGSGSSAFPATHGTADRGARQATMAAAPDDRTGMWRHTAGEEAGDEAKQQKTDQLFHS